jgi:hypothetical protein
MMREPFAFVVAAVADLSAADAVIEGLGATMHPVEVRRLDVVSLGRKVSGDVRFHRENVCDADGGRCWSAAAALAVALFPSVDADQPSDRAAERAALAAVSGRVATAVGRPALKDFGDLLDAAFAGVIVVTSTDLGEAVVECLPDSALVAVRTAELDPAELARLAQIATSSVRRPPRTGGDVSR